MSDSELLKKPDPERTAIRDERMSLYDKEHELRIRDLERGIERKEAAVGFENKMWPLSLEREVVTIEREKAQTAYFIAYAACVERSTKALERIAGALEKTASKTDTPRPFFDPKG
jgi:hypothetical protein